MKMTCFAALLVASTVHAQVYKCQEGGRTVYSDAPCAGEGHLLSAHGAPPAAPAPQAAATITYRQPSSYPAPRAQAPLGTGAPEAAAPVASVAHSVCPNEQQLRDIETSASSVTLGSREQQFLQGELARARGCVSTRSPYTAEDWRQLQDAWRAQSRIDPKDRESARMTAQGIHKLAEARAGALAAASEQQQRPRVSAPQQPAPGRSAEFLNCKSNGCSDSHGNWYYPESGAAFRSDGKWCQRIGDTVNCQ